MNWRKIFCAGMTAAIIFSAPVASQAAVSATEKLVQIEHDTYGAEQVGAVLNRISKLEKDYSGKNMQGNMNARIDAVYNNLYTNSGEPSIFSKLNALEWNFNREVSSGGLDKRISALESEILGKSTSGSFSDRIRELSKASFGGENIPLTQLQIPANTLVKVALVDSITSQTLQVGDVVTIKVAEDVVSGGKLIFAKGLLGSGKVASVRKAKGWTGRNGKVDIDFNELRTIDGRSIEIFVGDEAKQEMIDKQMVEGASLVAMDLNNDWSKVLVRGKNVDIKPGTELYVQVKNSAAVYSFPVGDGALKVSSDLKVAGDTPKTTSAKTTSTEPSTEKISTENVATDSDDDNFYLDDEE